MTLYDLVWQDEILIYPAVKRAVSVLAKATAWGMVATAALWLLGFALLVVIQVQAPGTEDVETYARFVDSYGGCLAVLEILGPVRELLSALLVPCLYLLALWCHQVLVAGRGAVLSRLLLLFLLFFSFLHPLCTGFLLRRGEPLLVNQFLLPAVLYTVLPCVVAVNWARMSALPLRYRLLLAFFLLALLGNYILPGSFLVLLLPCFSFGLLRRLARYAPLIISLPPKE